MPEIAHCCIQKAATHSHFIRSTPFEYQIVADIESYPSMCPVLCGSLNVLLL
jgi:ribosome-associated toxin RatA of RatAB toxin-antitoxin module